MTDFREIPHIFHEKKYLGLVIQGVRRGHPEYLYTGSAKIEGLSHQLNNVNAVTGNILVIVHNVAKRLGIKTNCFKEQPNDLPSSGKGLLDLLEDLKASSKPQSELEPLIQKMESLNEKVNNLERKLGMIDPEILKKILVHVESVDHKT